MDAQIEGFSQWLEAKQIRSAPNNEEGDRLVKFSIVTLNHNESRAMIVKNLVWLRLKVPILFDPTVFFDSTVLSPVNQLPSVSQ